MIGHSNEHMADSTSEPQWCGDRFNGFVSVLGDDLVPIYCCVEIYWTKPVWPPVAQVVLSFGFAAGNRDRVDIEKAWGRVLAS
jgi:hypothetical protein